jgi:hypothetical protein
MTPAILRARRGDSADLTVNPGFIARHPLAMDLSMRASGALLLWALVVGGMLWRLPLDADG